MENTQNTNIKSEDANVEQGAQKPEETKPVTEAVDEGATEDIDISAVVTDFLTEVCAILGASSKDDKKTIEDLVSKVLDIYETCKALLDNPEEADIKDAQGAIKDFRDAIEALSGDEEAAENVEKILASIDELDSSVANIPVASGEASEEGVTDSPVPTDIEDIPSDEAAVAEVSAEEPSVEEAELIPADSEDAPVADDVEEEFDAADMIEATSYNEWPAPCEDCEESAPDAEFASKRLSEALNIEFWK